ncbi:MAG: trigger factor [Phycisphaerales bacterium]|nr:trigger factor [Phycisphaerales bacterium]
MDMPGVANAMNDPILREKAEEQAEKLFDVLKKEVMAEARDLGTLRKELTVTVPAKVISDHITKNFDDIAHDAVLPGFRKGRAPRRLVERRFSGEVRNSLKTTIVGQSFFAAAEKLELKVLGDPLFRVDEKGVPKLVEIGDAIKTYQLPDNGDMTYVCELEVKPTFTVPELKGIEVKSPTIQITDDLVNEHIGRQLKIRGRLEPSTEGAATADDLVIADVTLHVGGAEIKKEDNVQLGIRPTRLDSVSLPNLGETLKGVKAGDKRETECTIPDDYERPDLRGQSGRFEFTIQEIKRLVPLSMEEFIKQLGAESEKELREFVHQDMEREVETLKRRALKEQVLGYLLDQVAMDLPPGLSARMTDRAVVRKVMELQQNGTPWNEIEARIDELRTVAGNEVMRDLKLDFIMEAVALALQVRITEDELNSAIAQIARRYNRRFDKVRDDLLERGLINALAEQIREEKCVELILRDAKIVEVTEPSEPAKANGNETAAKSDESASGAEKEPKKSKPGSRAKKAPKSGEASGESAG